jgi:hypothetical protein
MSPNNRVQRAVLDKVLGRVLRGQRTVADGNGYAARAAWLLA